MTLRLLTNRDMRLSQRCHQLSSAVENDTGRCWYKAALSLQRFYESRLAGFAHEARTVWEHWRYCQGWELFTSRRGEKHAFSHAFLIDESRDDTVIDPDNFSGSVIWIPLQRFTLRELRRHIYTHPSDACLPIPQREPAWYSLPLIRPLLADAGIDPDSYDWRIARGIG